MQSTLPRPGYDEELGGVLTGLKFPTNITPELIPVIRGMPIPAINDTIGEQPISHEERSIDGPGGPVTLAIFRSTKSKATGQTHPGLIWFHGGGFFSGSRFGSIQTQLDLVTDLDVVCISVDYRLGPEHPDPAPMEDGYAALVWVGENLSDLGIDPARLMIGGSSAGGGLAAGVTLYARDHAGPKLCAQLLQSPMLDDRLESASSRQYVNEGTFSRGSCFTGWNALLGPRRGGKDVSIYAAPGRATDLSRLPPAFIEAGSAETFRDDVVAYASLLWAGGSQAELHVWPGAFHRFQAFAPKAALTKLADETRVAWMKRTLSR
jgi:acetyl esterase/lipase